MMMRHGASAVRIRRPRGYALIFVLMVALALGIVVSGLFAFLAESVSSSKQSQEELQQLYGCDGALRLAIHESRGGGRVGAEAPRIGTCQQL